MTDIKRVLVTGASGFIGRHVIAPLRERGYEIHLTSSRAGADIDGIEGVSQVHVADLLDADQSRALMGAVKPSHLLHLAWIVKPGELIASVENLDWISASLSLLRSFHEAGGQRFVGVGSCYEYDWAYGYCSEELTPTNPDTLYGASKNAFRQVAEEYGRTHDLDFAWARVFFLYGPHENPNRLASSLILSLLRRQEAKSSHGLQIRDYMHVQDAADGIATLLDSAETGAFNIATGQAPRIRDIVETIGREAGAEELLRIGVLPARKNDTALVVADTQKASDRLGFTPRFDLLGGLRHTISWWKAELERNAHQTKE